VIANLLGLMYSLPTDGRQELHQPSFSDVEYGMRRRTTKREEFKKGNEWHFGMKCHIGVDAGSGYAHSLETTTANVHDITMAPSLIREDDEVVYGDAGYLGMEKRGEVAASVHLSSIDYRINRRRSSVQKVPDSFPDWEKQMERRKSSCVGGIEDHEKVSFRPLLSAIAYGSKPPRLRWASH